MKLLKQKTTASFSRKHTQSNMTKNNLCKRSSYAYLIKRSIHFPEDIQYQTCEYTLIVFSRADWVVSNHPQVIFEEQIHIYT